MAGDGVIVPRATSPNEQQIAIRVPNAWVKRASALVSQVAQPGMNVTRTDVFRVAIARGLEAMEAERK